MMGRNTHSNEPLNPNRALYARVQCRQGGLIGNRPEVSACAPANVSGARFQNRCHPWKCARASRRGENGVRRS